MDDIVGRLRDPAYDRDCLHRMAAADEIERLRGLMEMVRREQCQCRTCRHIRRELMQADPGAASSPE